MGMTAPPLKGTNWGTAKVMKDLAWTSTIPKTLVAGNYLIRHELIALHQANTPQFYAECAQIVVTGSGTASPSGAFLANIPGYAPQSDPGITVSFLEGRGDGKWCTDEWCRFLLIPLLRLLINALAQMS